VEGANHDLHSGVYGGAAPNPMQALAEIICALKDSDGRILVPGFYDRVVPPAAKEREAWARLPFDVQEYTEKEMGARSLVGEPEVPLFERLWARPTLEVHGIRGGFTGEGAKTVIPARAVAKVSTRLVADQRVEESVEQMQAAVKAACPKGVTAELKVLHTGAPSLTDPDNRFIHAAAEALQQTFGKETVYVRSGGSIPIVGVFDRYLGIPSVMMGFGLPDDNLHAPNEKFHLPNFYRGIETVARYLEILGR
jgi:acetylornithine deacetylase/succinyl-diaminopimelate desuccinylase-like protein